MATEKKIAVTMGDPGGVGPEVVVRALHKPEIRRCCNAVVVGSAGVITEAVERTGLPERVRPLADISLSRPEQGVIEVLDVKHRLAKKKGVPSVSAGRAVVACVKKAVELAMRKEVHAVVTAPVSKESLRLAGAVWPGHTELLAELTGAKEFAMMFAGGGLKVILCTIHMPLKDVPGAINRNVVYRTIRLAERGAAMLGTVNPGIAVAGLNPHAGESGIMGTEEIRSIIPAIERARKDGIDVTGPYPPDVVFHRAYKGEFDIIVCMYHDQGLVPFKMLAFDTGVNITVGLPIIRTSPDHGTAFDIAWKNMADPSSMIEAIKLAAGMDLSI